jgi:HEAT repeat protein
VAARALSECEATDQRVVAALAKGIADSDTEVRRLSIDALGQIGAAAHSSLPTLKAALADDDEKLRVRAALAIQRIAPEDLSFVPVLVKAMRAGDGRLLLAVGAMGPEAKWAMPTLIGLLSHESPPMRALAAQTLGRIGPGADDARAALQQALRDPNAAVQAAARAALERIEAK